MKLKTKDWVSTKDMAQALGCSRDHLLRLMRSGQFAQNKHYYIMNPEAHRVTYRWHLVNVKRSLMGHERQYQ